MKLAVAILTIIFAASGVAAQSQPPTLRIVTEVPNLPSEVFYGNTKVKPLRLRPGTNQPITIDDTDFFVQQQYIDFLGRMPDGTGFANWQETINNCPNRGFGIDNPTCDRVHVSAGFFLSDEFRGRGYFAYRFYEAGLGRRPAYAEFIPDMQRVGGAQSPEQEAASKVAFANEFVERASFRARYDQFQDPAAYVNELERTARVALANKQELISKLAAKELTRAGVLRAVVEAKAVEDRFFVEAFVAMQYFGYLRRDPDEVGYANWVQTLRQTGDFRHMIFGFIYSDEYRDRF